MTYRAPRPTPRPSPLARRLRWSLLLLLTAAAAVSAQEVTLKIHHFLNPQAVTHTQMLVPWAERVMAQSEGRIAVEIYPAMALGGRPAQLYRQVRDGVVDGVWTLIGYTPGQFPRSEVFELPFVHTNNVVATNLAIRDLYSDYLAPDYSDIHPLLIHVHAGNALHLRENRVRTLADLQGLRVRIPSRTSGWTMSALGARPVGMPAPDLPQALFRGVVDGGLLPFEVALPLKVHELTEASVVGDEDVRFGTSVFLFAMNQQVYQALPPDLQEVIDANSGEAFARAMGELWQTEEARGMAAARARGNAIVPLSEADTAALQQAIEPVIRRWQTELDSLGGDGEALVEAARRAVEQRATAAAAP